jgi:hypothetical protein
MRSIPLLALSYQNVALQCAQPAAEPTIRVFNLGGTLPYLHMATQYHQNYS